jgi:hypothetical protein
LKQGINWIVDADVAKFLDTIQHTQLRKILRQRVNDGAILRLIGMWLHVGVLEEGTVIRSEEGTPQGGVISPILANIFLHAVLDEWFEQTVRPRLAGNCFLVRYADDFVMGFAQKGDAEKVFRVLPKRFNVPPHGFWLLVGEREHFLDFDQFSWFRGATLDQVFEVQLLHQTHLYWPGLDVDLDMDRIENPERYPLVAGAEK